MTPSSPRAQQHATRAAFFIPGFATAAWAPMVPYAKAKAGLSDASLGAVLLCLGLGSLLAMPLAGALTGRLGCRRVMVITCAMMLCALPLLVLAPSPLALGAALFVFGAGVGALDCAMNMQAVAVERDAGRAMMSGFHAFYSIGGFVGAGCMTGLLILGTPLWLAALVSVAALLLVAVLSAPHWRRNGSCTGPAGAAARRGAVHRRAGLRGVPRRGLDAGLERGVPGRSAAGAARPGRRRLRTVHPGDDRDAPVRRRHRRAPRPDPHGLRRHHRGSGFTLATLVPSFPVALAATCWSGWAAPTSCRRCSRWRASSG
jgi:MFS family permease